MEVFVEIIWGVYSELHAVVLSFFGYNNARNIRKSIIRFRSQNKLIH